MSELKHVRDPVTGRCVACEALNKGGGFLDSAYHPDADLNSGSGLMVQQNQNRPITPVAFDPSDPNYIRAIRRGSVSLSRGQGVYTHGAAPQQFEQAPPTLVKRQSQPQILMLESPQQPNYRIIQPPPSNNSKIVLWQQAANGRVEPQQSHQFGMATVATAAMKQPRPSPQTVWVSPAHSGGGGATNLHGTNFYPGQYGGGRGAGGGGGSGGRCDSCRICCLTCCVCCRRNPSGRGGGVEAGPKRPYWSYEDGDSRGRCCKGWLIALCLLLVVAAIIAAILAALFSVEATAQTVPLNRRYLLVNNDTLCQQQARNGGTTLAGCAYTRAAELVVDSTFTNPPVLFSAGVPVASARLAAAVCAAAVAMVTMKSSCVAY